MKKVFVIALIMISMLLPTIAMSSEQIYFVTQSGAGLRDGSNRSNAWSVEQFNSTANWSNSEDSLRIDPGDTIYFSGVITQKISPAGNGTSEKLITLDGYESDNITYSNLSEASGRAVVDRNRTNNSTGIWIEKSYIVIQDFEIRETDHNGIIVTDPSHDVIIRRNFIYECSSGITVGGYKTPYPNNITIGGQLGNGNVIKNCGTTTADEDIGLSKAHDIIISYNHLYADNDSWGIDGVLAEGNVYDVLVEYNWIHGHNHDPSINGYQGEDGIDLKQGTVYNFVIRYNNIYDHTYQSCMTFQSSVHEIYAYGNLCCDSENGLITGDDDHGGGNDNIYFFGNIVYDIEEVGLAIGTQGQNGDVFIYNNTLAENGYCVDQYGVGACRESAPGNSTAWGHLRIQDLETNNTRAVVMNNIFYKGRPSKTDYRQFYVHKSDTTQTISDYNLYYWPLKSSKIYFGNAGSITLSSLCSGSDYGLPQDINSTDENPGLIDIDNNDYRISSTSSGAYGKGNDLGSGNIESLTINEKIVNVPWGFALGPNTNWSKGIPTIDERNFDSIGRWDRGAYAYGINTVLQPPINVLISNND